METNKIICGDNREVLKQFPDDHIDLVVTSPPYNLQKDYNEYKDNKSIDKYIHFLNGVFQLLYQKMK